MSDQPKPPPVMPAFVNYVQTQSNYSAQECTLTFVQATPVTKQDMHGEIRAKVTMTMSVLKQMHTLMGTLLEQYEKEFGSITPPPTLTDVKMH